MYSTPASAIAAIMASPLSSAGTSTQARLSLRSAPTGLFMAGSDCCLSVQLSLRAAKPVVYARRTGGLRSELGRTRP